MSVKKRIYRSEIRAAAADETRTRILIAAREVLGAGKGAPVFSLDAVARQAGVTRLTVYNQFGSKLGLLEALFDELAQEGGLYELQAVFAQADVEQALRQFVSVFCRFWSRQGAVLPRFGAVARLDDEIAASLKQRTERRRRALTVLVDRLMSGTSRKKTDLIDTLFALTGFEMFHALSVRQRSRETVETILQDLVADTVRRFTQR